MRQELIVDLLFSLPGRVGTLDDGAIGLLEYEVSHAIFGRGHVKILGIDNIDGVVLHPFHGGMRAGLVRPAAIVDEGWFGGI